MTERKIICKLLTGSRLYGTNHPDSDEDYVGVFLPSTEDLLGMRNCPTEWSQSVKVTDGERNSKGDVDCKFYSLQRFFESAAQGQPGQLEMLFAPPHATLESSPEWEQVISNKNLFVSRNGIAPFIGFALNQAHKATIKGGNYNQIKKILEWGTSLTDTQRLMPIGAHYQISDDGSVCIFGGVCEVKRFVNEHGYTMVEIAGRDFDVGLKLKVFLNSLKVLMDRYGSRSKAAAEVGNDLKSFLHAYRLISEAKEYLLTGNITMPRPDAEFLKTIRTGEYQADFYQEITDKINEIRHEIEPKCLLPNKPNHSKIEKLCQTMLYAHLFGKS